MTPDFAPKTDKVDVLKRTFGQNTEWRDERPAPLQAGPAVATRKRVLKGSLTAFWATGGNLEIIGWVSDINDGPHTVQDNKRGRIESLGMVSYEWMMTLPGLPIDFDTRTVNDHPMGDALPAKLGFVYYEL
jgi:hypothetical protein